MTSFFHRMRMTRRIISLMSFVTLLLIPFYITQAAEPTTTNKPSYVPVVPSLEVAIPGVSFKGSEVGISNDPGGQKAQMPFLGQYIGGVYNYLIGIGVITASVMLIYGGFLYIIGATFTQISKGKSVIQDALIGLVLLFASWTILHTLNPNTLKFASISIDVIDEDPFSLGQYSFSPPVGAAPIPAMTTPSAPAPSGTETTPVKPPAGTGGTPAPVGPESAPQPIKVNTDSASIAKDVIEGAKLAGVNPCTILAICNQETRLRSVWNGIQGGTPKEKAGYFGPCGVGLSFIQKDCAAGKKCNLFTDQIRAQFPDFPPILPSSASPEEKLADKNARREWLLQNIKGSAFVASLFFKNGYDGGIGNEVLRLASYSAGPESIRKALRSNGACTPEPNLTVARASSDAGSALAKSCIPKYTAIAKAIRGHVTCEDENYACVDVKPNKRSEYEGHCPSDVNKLCFAMDTDTYARNVLEFYPQMQKTYGCDK